MCNYMWAGLGDFSPACALSSSVSFCWLDLMITQAENFLRWKWSSNRFEMGIPSMEKTKVVQVEGDSTLGDTWRQKLGCEPLAWAKRWETMGSDQFCAENIFKISSKLEFLPQKSFFFAFASVLSKLFHFPTHFEVNFGFKNFLSSFWDEFSIFPLFLMLHKANFIFLLQFFAHSIAFGVNLISLRFSSAFWSKFYGFQCI